MIASFFCLKGSDFIKTVTEQIETIDHVLSRCIRSKTFPGIAKAMAEQWG